MYIIINMSGKKEKLLMIILLVWAILATSLLADQYTKNIYCRSILSSISSKTVSVNLLIDYGNGTKRWFNNTITSRNSTFFSLLLSVAQVNYTSGKYGVFINSINGVTNRVTGSSSGRFWMWYYYNKKDKKWVPGPVAVDKWPLKDGDVLKMVYQEVKW